METPTSPRRPLAQHSKSFSRFEEPPRSPQSRNRASTVQGGTIPEALFPRHITASPEPSDERGDGDVFESKEEGDSAEGSTKGTDTPVLKTPGTFEELPIEIRSLTERYVKPPETFKCFLY